MFEFFKFDEGIQEIPVLWVIITVLIFLQIISHINQLLLTRRNRKLRKQIREMRKHIQFLAIQAPPEKRAVLE